LGAAFAGETIIDDQDFSGRVIGRYNISENVNTYLTLSRGYKGAGIDVAESANLNFVNEEGGLPVLDPEIPTLLELGFKGWFLDETLSINTALFTQSVEDLQSINRDAAGLTRNISITEILSKGLEADITYLPPVDGLTLSASLTWLDVKYEKFDDQPALEGADYQGVPEWAISFIGDYGFEIGDGGWDSFVRAEYYWQDEKNSSAGGEEAFAIDSYGLLNLRAGVTSPSGLYSVVFGVENATGEDYPYFVGGSTFAVLGGSATSQFLGPDRTYRLTIGAKF
jgi:iron complex outermembrane receptor protein